MLIKTKAPVEQASGAQGNEIVFFRWRGSQVARNWAQPANPNSTQQQAIRGYLTTISRNWSGVLTDEQRAAWIAYAAGRDLTNILGETYRMTGLNAYVQHNTILSMAGLANITDPPSTTAPAPFTALTKVTEDVGDVSIQASHGNSSVVGLKVYTRYQKMTTGGQSPDIRKTASVGDTFAHSIVACPASDNAYTIVQDNLREALIVDDVIGLSVAVFNANGQMSPWFTVKTTILEP